MWLALAHAASPTAVAVAPDGAFAIVGAADGARTLWWSDGRRLDVAPIELPPPSPFAYEPPAGVRWIVISSDGRVAASGHYAGVVALFDPRDGRPGPPLGPAPGGLPETRLRVSGPPDWGFGGHGWPSLPVAAFSADGERLLVGSETRITLRAVRTGEARRTWTTDERVVSLAFASTGEPVAHVGHEVVVLGDVPRFVAHDVEWSQAEPGGTLLIRAPGGEARFDPVGGSATIVERPPPRWGEVEELAATSADGRVRVRVGDDGVPRFGSP